MDCERGSFEAPLCIFFPCSLLAPVICTQEDLTPPCQYKQRQREITGRPRNEETDLGLFAARPYESCFEVFPPSHFRQMSHTKPYIRKKAVLIMYKVFLRYPESLRPAFPRLKEKLEDPDPGQ